MKSISLLRRALTLLLLFVSLGISADNVLRSNYSPGGSSWSDAATIDWATQEVYVKVDLSGCYGSNENVLSVGSSIGSWGGGEHFHLYYTASTSTLQVNYLSSSYNSIRQDVANISGTVEIVITRDKGLTINGTAVGSPSSASGLFALSSISIGSQEGYTRSHATYSEISVKTMVELPAAPTFSLPGGKYKTTQTVTISSTVDGGVIHYTTDGSTPTASSPVYSGPVTVSETTTLKAVVVKDGVASDVTSATYTFDESTSTEVYDFTGIDATTIVNLFKTAQDEGHVYPTDEEFRAAGIQLGDLHFIRSHTRYRPIMDRSDCLLKDAASITYTNRNLWLNLPMDDGKLSWVGQPSGEFLHDNFNIWNYTNIFGSWNHGFFGAPSVWTDAAHKNGSYLYSGIAFFDYSTGSSASDWQTFITTRNGSTYTYAEPIINALMYLGQDGINYNWESSGYDNTNVIAFHKQLYKLAEQKGFDDFHCGIYTQIGTLSNRNGNGLFGNSSGRTHDLMLNYSGGDFQSGSILSSSANAATSLMGTTEGLYAGVWIVTMNRAWTGLNYNENAKKVSLCLWGEHSSSRFYQYVFDGARTNAEDQQALYTTILERLVSGGNQNPLTRPAVASSGINEASAGAEGLKNYAGLATWIPERSAIQGNLPFATNFNLGNGERYSYKGKTTGGEWYNMGNQDIVPTYRWLVVSPGTTTAQTNITPRFYYKDQYNGGTSLKLSGTLNTTGTDVVLFKTNLTVSKGGAYALVAVKDSANTATKASNLYVILKKGQSWIEVPYGNVSGGSWEEKKLSIDELAQGDVISAIGLRVRGNGPINLLVGKLEINDEVKTPCANVTNLECEVKAETQNTMTMKLWWDVDQKGTDRAAWDLTYNDEVGIDHFEVMYKNGENGRISEVMRTTSWGTLAPNVKVGLDDDPWIGVRSVSTDLKTYGVIQWIHLTRASAEKLQNIGYGPTYEDSSFGNVNSAINTGRYLTSVTTTGATQNLNWTASSYPADRDTHYLYVQSGTTAAQAHKQAPAAAGQLLEVAQGQNVTLRFTAYGGGSSSDGLRYSVSRGWIDFNRDYQFNDALPTTAEPWGECLYAANNRESSDPTIESGYTVSFTVPSDATPGLSRLRMVFTDAWAAEKLKPVGAFEKGFAIDFDVLITGTNTPRGTLDNHDQGVADEPDGAYITTGIQEIAGDNGYSEATVSDGKLSFNNADRAWLYGVDGSFVRYMPKAETLATASLPAGVYIVKMQSGAVFRSQKVVIK